MESLGMMRISQPSDQQGELAPQGAEQVSEPAFA